MYSFSNLEKNLEEVTFWLKKEYSSIRTGQASPAILDSVKVESYGSLMPLNQVSSITTEDAKTIRVSPWDSGLIKVIEKTITDAGLGVSLVTDEKGVRVIFPDLTSERRVMLVKLAKEKLEKARVSVRSAREEEKDKIEKSQKDGDITEDEEFKLKEKMQTMVEDLNKELEELFAKKEKEINI